MRLVLYTRGHGAVKRKKSKIVDSEICLESKNQNGSFNPENAFLSVHLKTKNPAKHKTHGSWPGAHTPGSGAGLAGL